MGAGLYRRLPAGDSSTSQAGDQRPGPTAIMIPVRCRALLVVTASSLLCAALPAFADAPSGGAKVAVGRSHTQASVGTTCTRDPDNPDGRPSRSCTDVAYPLPMHGSVTLKARRRLRILFAGRVSSVL